MMFAVAIRKQKQRHTRVPTTAPMLAKLLNCIENRRRDGYGYGKRHHDRRVPQRKKKPTPTGRWLLA